MTIPVHRFFMKCRCGGEYAILGLYFSAALDIYIDEKCPHCGREKGQLLNVQAIVDWCHTSDMNENKEAA